MNYSSKKIFLVVLVFCFFNPAKGAEEKKEERDLFRMGFEIEFPSYGISKKDQNSYVEKDPILQNNSNTWVLYRDTLDSRVEKAYFKSESPGIWNLEFGIYKNSCTITSVCVSNFDFRQLVHLNLKIVLSPVDLIYKTWPYNLFLAKI